MQTVTRQKTPISTPGRWRPADPIVYDDLLITYLLRAEGFKTEQYRINQSVFDSNLQRARALCENLFAQLNRQDLKVKRAYLKAESLTSFRALFMADLEEYLKDEFMKAASIARAYRERSARPTFNLSFTFLYDAATLNEHAIFLDGYFTIYYGKE